MYRKQFMYQRDDFNVLLKRGKTRNEDEWRFSPLYLAYVRDGGEMTPGGFNTHLEELNRNEEEMHGI